MDIAINTTKYKNYEILTQKINSEWIFYIKEKGLLIYRGVIKTEDTEDDIIDFIKFKIDSGGLQK